MTKFRRNKCIEATAGSGKTTLMVNELKSLLIDHNVAPESCLAITFTDKAANEMVTRLRSVLLDSGLSMPFKTVNRMNIETIHSFCNRILKKHALLINQSPHYTIFSSIELKRRLEHHAAMLWSQSVYSPPEWLIECLATWSLDQWSAMLINAYHNRDTISYWFENGYYNLDLPDDIDATLTTHYEEKCQAFKVSFNHFLALIEADKKDDNWLDHDDILFKTLQLLSNVDWLRHELQSQLQHIFVDEFQDTSPVQWKIVHLLCHDENPFESTKLWVVGDRCQAIYGFRGADDALMEMVINTKHNQLEHVKNTNNYRSNPAIITFINQLFRRLFADQNTPFLEMVPKKDPDPATGIECSISDSLSDELAGITNYIHQMKSAFNLTDIAILVRKNYDIQIIKAHLETSGIPVKVNKGAGLCELDNIQALICFLKGLLNTDDDLAWYGIARDILKIADDQISSMLNQDASLFKCLCQTHSIVQQWMSRIQSGNARSELKALSWSLPIIQSDSDQKAAAYFLAEFNRQWYVVDGNNVALLSWLEACIKQPKMMGIENESSEDAVQIMTLHAAKGLEFPVVIVPFMQSQFNMGATDPLLVSRVEGLGVSVPSLPKNPIRSTIYESEKTRCVLEELRLFYVTLTRAKSYIYLSAQQLKRKNMSRLTLLLPYLIEANGTYGFDFEYTKQALAPSKSVMEVDSYHEPTSNLIIYNNIEPVNALNPISVSSILDYLECPKQMVLQRIAPLEFESSSAQKEGEDLHDALGKALTNRQQTPKDGDPQWLTTIIESDWYSQIVVSGHLEVEKPFEYRMNNTLIRGRFDAVWYCNTKKEFRLFEFKRSLGNDVTRYQHQATIYADILQGRFSDYTFNYNESKLVDLRTARTVSVIPNSIDWQPSIIALEKGHCNPNSFFCNQCKYNSVVENCSQSEIMLT